jgi:hypothetical protein
MSEHIEITIEDMKTRSKKGQYDRGLPTIMI